MVKRAKLMMAGVFAMILAFGLVSTTPAPVEAQQVGLVNVSTGNILSDIAIDLDVAISQIPVTVQVPIGVAANVCNVAVNVLAAAVAQEGEANCEAVATSQTFNRFVQRQLLVF